MAREITIMTPEQVEVRFELAGIGSRFIAMIIDTLLQSLVILVFFLLALGLGFGVAHVGSVPDAAIGWMTAICILLFFVITSGYFLYFEATKNGQTPGKKTAGIRVIRDTGHPVDFRSALLRNLMRIVDSLPGMYGVALVSAFFSPQYRRLGDYVGGTLVVKVGRKAETAPRPYIPVAQPVPDPAAIPTEFATAASPPAAYALPTESMPYVTLVSRDDCRAVKHFLGRRMELEPNVAEQLARQLAGPIAQALQLDPIQITNPAAFLQAFVSEWERRLIR